MTKLIVAFRNFANAPKNSVFVAQNAQHSVCQPADAAREIIVVCCQTYAKRCVGNVCFLNV